MKPAPVEMSRVIMHSAIEGPVDLRINPVFSVGSTIPSLAGSSATKYAAVPGFPVTLACPLRTACAIHIRGRLEAIVFAFEPQVEIDVLPPAKGSTHAPVRYRDASSVSAALAQVHTSGIALRAACLGKDEQQIATIEQQLRDTSAAATPSSVAARMVLVENQCTNAAENVAIARTLARDLAPDAPELLLWTGALARLGEVTGDPSIEVAVVDAVVAQHPNDHVVAALLLGRVLDANKAGDRDAVVGLLRRLRDPRFAGTNAPMLARTFVAMTNPLRVAPGDRLPTIEVDLVDGSGTVSTSTPRTQPMLVYFSASWCRGCVDSLPRLRTLANAHPELQIVYVMWESPAAAQTFAQHHSPIPGKLTHADEDRREAILATVIENVVLPSFVLVDAQGTVIATSRTEKLDALDAKLRALDGASDHAPD